MSIIVFDTKVVAADKKWAMGDGSFATYPKIEQQKDGTILGFVGFVEIGKQLLDWYKNGEDSEKFKPIRDDDNATLIVIKPNGEYYWYESSPQKIRTDQTGGYAWGNCSFAAQALLSFGFDPITIVKRLSELNIFCGGGINFYKLGEEKGIQEWALI